MQTNMKLIYVHKKLNQSWILYCFFWFLYVNPFQRVGTVHGEELSFVFGAPIADDIGLFARNYSRAEVALSESIVQYFANFIKTG